MKILIIIALLIVGYFILRSVGGESVTAPEVTDPDLPIPDSPEDGVNSVADWLDSRPEWFWQFASMGIVLFLIYLASIKMPKLFYVGVGLAVMAFIAFAVMQ